MQAYFNAIINLFLQKLPVILLYDENVNHILEKPDDRSNNMKLLKFYDMIYQEYLDENYSNKR